MTLPQQASIEEQKRQEQARQAAEDNRDITSPTRDVSQEVWEAQGGTGPAPGGSKPPAPPTQPLGPTPVAQTKDVTQINRGSSPPPGWKVSDKYASTPETGTIYEDANGKTYVMVGTNPAGRVYMEMEKAKAGTPYYDPVYLRKLAKEDPYIYTKLFEGGEKAVKEAIKKREVDLKAVETRSQQRAIKAAQKELNRQQEEVKRQQKEQEAYKAKYLVIGDKAIERSEWDKLDIKYQIIAHRDGLDAMEKAMRKDYVKYVLQDEPRQRRYDEAIKKLEPYKNEDGSYDLYAALNDKIKTPIPGKKRSYSYKQVITESDLKNAGFKDEDIKSAAYQAKLEPFQKTWQGLTPWKEEKGEKATVKGGFTMAAELLVPGVYAARNWKSLSAGGKAIAIGADLAAFIPILRTAGTAGRVAAGSGTRAAVIKASTTAAIKEAAETIAAPVNVVLHPVGSAKAAVTDIRNLAEDIAHPRKLPEAVITTTYGTVRLKVTKATTPAEAMAIRDVLMDLARRGERPIIKIGDQVFELSQSPLMKEAKGGLTHSTTFGESFRDVLKVAEKPGMPPSEQGLFLSHEPLPRFTITSAFGKKGDTPLLYVTSKETAAKAITTGKVYSSPAGKVAEMEMKLPVGAETAGVKQKLFTRIGPEGTRVEIWLETPLTMAQRAKLKGKVIVASAKATFTPALRIKGRKKMLGLTDSEVRQLNRILKESGNLDQARQLLRAQRLSRSFRVAAPRLAQFARRISNAQVSRARQRLNISLSGTVRPVKLSDREVLNRVRDSIIPKRLIKDRGKTERVSTSLTRAEIERSETARAATTETTRARATTNKAERAEARSETEREDIRAEVEREVKRLEAERGKPVSRLERKRIEQRVLRDRTRIPAEDRRRGVPFYGEQEKKKRRGKDGKADKKEWTPAEIESAIAWKDGFVIHAIKSPYRRGVDERTYHVDNVPPGLKLVTMYQGPGSQQRSAKAIKGPIPKRLTVDVGNQDVIISKPKGQGIRIKHRLDKGTVTRSQLTVSKYRNISKKRGRVYHTRDGSSTIISRRALKSVRGIF